MNFTIYDANTGKIKRSGSSSTEETCLLQIQEDEDILLGVAYDDEEYYIEAGEVTLRPNLGVEQEYNINADAEDQVSIDLPIECTITYNGEQHFSQNDFLFDTDVEGDYTFYFNAPFPYRSIKSVIHAV